MYVWFDALTNYVTALGYGSENIDLFKKYWPADAHVIGKEINRFHSLLWPAMLMSAGLELPKQICVHGWITSGGQKMSKTLGNVVDPLKLISEYSLESLRYFLAREIPFDNDGDFTREKLKERYNADLANGLGNLTNRILVMVEKYTDGFLPPVKNKDKKLINFLTKDIWPNFEKNMATFDFAHALEDVWKFITFCDQMISEKQPWALAKAGKNDEVANLLGHLCESLRHIAVMIWPTMPETSEKILSGLGLNATEHFTKPLKDLRMWSEILTGQKISKVEALFPRL